MVTPRQQWWIEFSTVRGIFYICTLSSIAATSHIELLSMGHIGSATKESTFKFCLILLRLISLNSGCWVPEWASQFWKARHSGEEGVPPSALQSEGCVCFCGCTPFESKSQPFPGAWSDGMLSSFGMFWLVLIRNYSVFPSWIWEHIKFYGVFSRGFRTDLILEIWQILLFLKVQ